MNGISVILMSTSHFRFGEGRLLGFRIKKLTKDAAERFPYKVVALPACNATFELHYQVALARNSAPFNILLITPKSTLVI